MKKLYDMTMCAGHQESLRRCEPWIDWGPTMKEKRLQGSYKARWPPKDHRKGKLSDSRTNPFQEGEDDMIMGAVHQMFQLQLDSKSNWPVEMTSKCSLKTTNSFVFE